MRNNGHVIGGILLVAGCCIGAGMLGLPILSAKAGFQPSILMFIFCWIFMCSTGLLLLEVNLSVKEETNLVTLAERTLGTFGKVITWVLFAFLFYCLMVAYASASGALFADFFEEMVGYHLPDAFGSFLMTAFFGCMVYLGTSAVDYLNRGFMLGLIVSYCLLLFLGAPHVNSEFLKTRDFSAVIIVIPAMVISFGFHNLIPSLTTYLNRDIKKLKIVFILGSLIPLLIYIAWEWLLLGMVPFEGSTGFKNALNDGDLTTKVLKTHIGGSFVVDLAHYFAFFAIVTSFLGVALSFVDFLSDGLHIKKTAKGKFYLSCLALIPPFVFSLVYPKLFLSALNCAGSFGAVILFGLLPALMVWSLRYQKKMNLNPIVPGGKWTLGLVIFISLTILYLQFLHPC